MQFHFSQSARRICLGRNLVDIRASEQTKQEKDEPRGAVDTIIAGMKLDEARDDWQGRVLLCERPEQSDREVTERENETHDLS